MIRQMISPLAILLLLFITPITHAENELIPLYGMFKTTIIDNTRYNNPFDYKEISYTALFQTTNSPSYQVSGFYNGHNSEGEPYWEVRFKPNIPGLWNYRIINDKGITTKTGSFEVANAPAFPHIRGHIKVDPENSKYLVHADGTPHFWVGGKWMSARDYGPEKKGGFINKGIDKRSNVSYGYKSNQQIIEYLDLLVKYKHNGILLKIGQYPLEKDRISWDLEWIQRGEWLVNEALIRGINVQVNMFDTWARDQDQYFSFNMEGSRQAFDVWNDGDDHIKQNYLRTIISRFSSFANVYWELGNEMEHKPNCGECFVKLANEKYIPWIKRYDPYNLPIGLSEEIWRDANVEMGFLHQTNKLPDKTMDRPVIMNELVRYERPKYSKLESIIRKLFDKKNHRGLWHDDAMNDEDLRSIYRRTFWKVFTHGGSGSSEATWLHIDNPLSKNALQVMEDHMYLSETIHKFLPQLNTMYPLSNFIESNQISEAISSRGNDSVMISYFDAGYGNSLKADTITLVNINQNYKATWLDPSTGSIISTNSVSQDKKQLERPAYTDDLVLIIQSEN